MQYLGNILGRILAKYRETFGKCALPNILPIHCQFFNRKKVESVANIWDMDLDIIREMPLPIIFMFYYQKITSHRYCVKYCVPCIKRDHKNKASLVIRTLPRAEIDSVAHILQRYWKTLLLIYLQHSASSCCKTIGAICLGCYQQQVANNFD